MYKTCSSCKKEKDLDDFRNHPLGKYGKHSICIECQRAYSRKVSAEKRKNEPDKVRKSKKESYERNKDSILAKGKEYYKSARDYILERAANYREKNREKIRQSQRKYYSNNKSKVLESGRAYREKNSEAISNRLKNYRDNHKAETRQRNRARKLDLKFSNLGYKQADWNKCITYWGNKCAACGRIEGDGVIISADHWIPLSKGGITHITNIIPLCHGKDGCNNKKHDKYPLDWLLYCFTENEARKIYNSVEEYFKSVG